MMPTTGTLLTQSGPRSSTRGVAHPVSHRVELERERRPSVLARSALWFCSSTAMKQGSLSQVCELSSLPTNASWPLGLSSPSALLRARHVDGSAFCCLNPPIHSRPSSFSLDLRASEARGRAAGNAASQTPQSFCRSFSRPSLRAYPCGGGHFSHWRPFMKPRYIESGILAAASLGVLGIAAYIFTWAHAMHFVALWITLIAAVVWMAWRIATRRGRV